MGCCATANYQLELAKSIDNNEYENNIKRGHIRQKSRNDDLTKPMKDWHRGQVIYWLKNNHQSELKHLATVFHAHQISGLTLVSITKTELQQEMQIQEDTLCDLFLHERDKYIDKKGGGGTASKQHHNIPVTHSSNITMDDIDISISRHSDSNTEFEIKYNTEISEKALDVTSLYNLLQQYNMQMIKSKLIDLRDRALFNEQHILGSVHVAYSDSYTKRRRADDDGIADFKDLAITDTNSKVPMVTHLESFRSDTKLIFILDRDNQAQQELKDKLENFLFSAFRMHEYMLLDDAFTAFYDKYPFLCHTSKHEDDGGDGDGDGNHEDQSFDDEQLDDKYPSEVMEGRLFVGDLKQSQSFDKLEHLKITHVLSVCDQKQEHGKLGVQYKHIAMKDEENEHILNGNLEDALKWIDEVLADDDKNKVLVHCIEGVSRSATIVIAYLMQRNQWSVQTAFNYVKEIRPSISPNGGFKRQLETFQHTLNIQD